MELLWTSNQRTSRTPSRLRSRTVLPVVLAASLFLGACNFGAVETLTSTETDTKTASAEVVDSEQTDGSAEAIESNSAGEPDSGNETADETADETVDDTSSDDTDQAESEATATAVEAVDADTLASGELITLTDAGLTISSGGTYTLTGTSSASVVVDTEDDVVLVLDGVDIDSTTGAAIVVTSADNVDIVLADGSDNRLEDASVRDDAEIDGTLYSTADLTISGSGTLTVIANYEDGIVTKDDLVVLAGSISIEAVDEGIRGRDSITVSGGDISIVAGGDGMKTTNAESLDKGSVHITGGTITIDAGDDGIKAATTMTIDDGTIEVLGSLEGLEAINITINGGDITIDADDDGINAVAGEIDTDVFIEVTGGTVDVTVGTGDTDGFDANGSITISGGDITVTAPTSSFDYDTTAEMTGGTLTVNGETMTSIPASRMGGGGGGGGGRPGG